MNKFSLVFVCGGAIALALSLVMGWLGVTHIVRGQIKKSARLVKGRDSYNRWKGPPNVPIYIKIFIFNITNPEQVKTGGKPILEEIGPYTYMDRRTKIEIEKGERNHTLEYRNKRMLSFNQEMSVGVESDMLNVINVPFLTVSKLTVGLEDADSVQTIMDGKLVEAGEGIFKFLSVREFLFDGVCVESFLEIFQVQESNDTKIPECFLDGKYGFLEGSNKTDDFYYEVNTGEFNYKDFGKIEARNNETHLPWWKHESCNSLNGTDGTLFSPFLTRETRLKSYLPEICRTLNYVYEKDINFKGVAGYQFMMDTKIFQGSHHTPENWCYCVDADPKACERNGVISIAHCNDGLPLSISLPHFLGADEQIREAVDGIQPIQENHTTFIDLEITTGRVLKSAKRLQLNVDVQPNPRMPTIAKLPILTLPILWMEEYIELREENLKYFENIKFIGEFVDNTKWLFVAGSFACVVIGIVVGMIRRDKNDIQLIK